MCTATSGVPACFAAFASDSARTACAVSRTPSGTASTSPSIVTRAGSPHRASELVDERRHAAAPADADPRTGRTTSGGSPEGRRGSRLRPRTGTPPPRPDRPGCGSGASAARARRSSPSGSVRHGCASPIGRAPRAHGPPPSGRRRLACARNARRRLTRSCLVTSLRSGPLVLVHSSAGGTHALTHRRDEKYPRSGRANRPWAVRPRATAGPVGRCRGPRSCHPGPSPRRRA